MNTINVENCKTLLIGRRGENEVTTVAFDFAEWASEFGSGVVDLYVKRFGDESAYPVVLTIDGTVASWLVTETDTNVAGYGKAEYVYRVDGKIAKSAVFPFFVAEDIGQPASEPPDPYESWLEQLTALGAETEAHAQAAEQSAENAAESAEDAAQSAASAEGYAGQAETAAGLAQDAQTASEAARDAAQTAQASAESSATAASGSAASAAGSATAAAGSASDASSSASAAGASASAASASATTASNAATAAQTAQSAAEDAAEDAQQAAQEAHVEYEQLSGEVDDLSDEVAQQKSLLNAQADVISTEDVFAGLLLDTASTVNGVSYTLDGNTLTMLGTASRNSPFVWASISPVPDSLKGKMVFVHINITGNNTLKSGSHFFGIRYKTPEITTYAALQSYYSNGVFALQIPSDVTALQFRTLLLGSSVVDGTVTVEIVPAYDFNAITRTMCIKYEAGNYGGGAAPERLHIYMPTETGYILYLMYHFVDASNNSNVWQIYNVYQVDGNFDYETRKTLTVTGEWECAIHLRGRNDFSGGHTHGDEVMEDVVFMVDGVPVTISDYTKLTPCNELRIIRNGKMYDPADSTTPIADHGAEYIFSSDGELTINQSLKWLVAEQLTNCFLCMFLPSKNYIDRASANNDFVIETLPSETGTPLTTITKPKSTGVTMWDTASGMFADVSVPVYPTGLTGGDKMTIHDNSNQAYNKVYFCVCTGGASAIGELWQSKSIYKIGYKSVT